MMICPHCFHKDEEYKFYRLAGVDRRVMFRLPKIKNFFDYFKTGEHRQLYACPSCGVSFILPLGDK